MIQYLKEMLSNDSNKSSARAINFMGALLGASLLAYDTYAHGKLDSTNFGLFLTYCGMGYGTSKWLDRAGEK